MKIATEKSIRKSFSDVRKDISELKDRIANMDKELGILMGKLSSIENLGFRK